MLTPLDIQNKEFRRSFRGYSEDEVDEFLDQLAQDYEWLYLENQRMKEKLEDTQAGVTRYQEMEQTIKDTLVMAQKNAEELRENTQREVEVLISEAKQHAWQIVKESEEKAHQLVIMAEDRADEILAEAEEKMRTIIREYQWLEKHTKIYRAKLRSFLEAQLDLIGRQEQETMVSLQETMMSLNEVASTACSKNEPDVEVETVTEIEEENSGRM